MQNKYPTSREKGDIGENIAAEYIVSIGYKILKRNFKFGHSGELDIIAIDDEQIVFIEVKTRSDDKFGNPLFSIIPQKQKHLRRAAEGYLYVNKIINKDCRFDVIIIDNRCEPAKIEHLKNAF